MKLYIANTTKQNHDLLYRMPNDIRVDHEFIPMGEQRLIRGDRLTKEEISFIVSQHERYGLVDAAEIDRTRRFVGLCYSIDRPVVMETILRFGVQNDEALVKQGQEIRQIGAAATIESIREEDRSSEDKVKKIQFEAVEEKQKPTDPEGFHEHLEFGAVEAKNSFFRRRR